MSLVSLHDKAEVERFVRQRPLLLAHVDAAAVTRLLPRHLPALEALDQEG